MPAWRKFFAQFQDVFVILLPIATLISANVIASDKTGTLTKNEITLLMVVTAGGRVNLGGTGYAPEGEVLREGGGKLMVRSSSSLYVRFQPSTVLVTPCCMSAMYAARCIATRPKKQ